MDIFIPKRDPLETDLPEPKPAPATIGQTGNAQFSAVFTPAITEFRSFQEDEYDPESVERVESIIEKRGLTGEDARFIRRNGIGSEQNTAAALDALDRMDRNKDVIGRSTGLNLMATDPATVASIAIPVGGFAAASAAAKAGYKGVSAKASINQVAVSPNNTFRQVVDATEMLRGERLSAGQVAKIGAIDAGLTDGSINLTKALSEVDISDDPQQVLADAALMTAASTAIGGALGYGLGALTGAPMNAGRRVEQVKQNYGPYLNHVSNDPVKAGEDLSYSGKWFTESVFMKLVPTPIRTIINDKAIPERYKNFLLSLGGDNGILFEANRAGKSIGNSVLIESGRRDGDWFKVMETIDGNYRNVSPRGMSSPLSVPVTSYTENLRKMMGKDSFAPEEWYNHIGDLYVKNTPYDKMTPEEASSVQAVESFFNKYRQELEEVGLINGREFLVERFMGETGKRGKYISVVNSLIRQNKKFMDRELKKLNKSIDSKQKIFDDLSAKSSSRGLTQKQQDLLDKLSEELPPLKERADNFNAQYEKINNAKDVEELSNLYDQLDLTPAMAEAMPKLRKAMDETGERIRQYKEAIDFRKGKFENAPESMGRHFPRFFNRRVIEERREEFLGILVKWFRENPENYVPQPDGSIKKVAMSTDPAELAKRADQTINNILGETDEDAIDAMFTGFGRSSPLMSRRLDIPNELVADFIVKDVKEVLIAYTSRVAPKIEFHKRVRDPKTGKLITLEDHLENMRQGMIDDGVPQRKIERFIKNYVAVYDQIVGTNRQRPDAIDTKIADGLRTATTWTFLGGAGVAALGDMASLFMDHELRTIGQGFLGLMDDVTIGLGRKELNLAGEALEIVKGTTYLRYQESLSNDLFNNGLSNKLNNAFYNLNLLAPVTVAAKSMDALLRGHTLLEASERFLAGNASKFEKEFLARYNVTEADMKAFAKMPTEKSSGGLRLPNTEAWTDENAVNVFRNALRSGVMNRIIMGTPADKPIVMGGVAYVPESVASKLPFDLPIDPRVPGYRRVESGLLALPFTFYSYTMGALSKITGNYATGSVRNKAAHTAVAMGLGAAIVKFRTPSWAWDEMDTEDKIMRAFDFSGLAAIYSDMTYRALAMANEFGLEPNFPIQPKYKGPVDPLGAAISVGGAPADYAYGVASGLGEMFSGNYGDGAKDLIRHTPLIGAMALGGIIEDSALGLAGSLPNRQ